MKYRTFKLSTLVAFVALGGAQAWAQQAQNSSIFSVAVSSGAATVAQKTGIPSNAPALVLPDNLAGMTYIGGDFGLTGDHPVSFFALTGRALAGAATSPQTTPQAADFTSYWLPNPTSKQTYSVQSVPDRFFGGTYSGLVYAPSNYTFSTALEAYTIHHGTSGTAVPTDYWTAIIPSTGTGTLVTDYKPMSWPAGSGGAGASGSAPGLTGYFALSEADDITAAGPVGTYALLAFYYLRTDSGAHTQFGQFVPAAGTPSTDTLDLTTAVGSFGVGGYTAMAYYQGAVASYPANQFYYLRTDSTGTGNTILGRLNPDKLTAGVRTISDIANLGGTFNTLTYVTTATFDGANVNQFYTTGLPVAGAQAVSFAAIPDQKAGVSFTVAPSAARIDGTAAGTIALTVVSGTATISGGPTFTVTPTSPGIVTLQATQAGGGGYLLNYLRQSFNASGPATTLVTANQTVVTGTTSTFTPVTFTGGTAPIAISVTQSLPTGLTFSTTTGVFTATNMAVAASTPFTVIATDANGAFTSKTFNLTVAVAAPVITNSPLTAAGSVGTPFSFTIQASGSPTSWTATPLPAGLTISGATISGTPSAAGVTAVLLGAANANPVPGNATLSITVVAAGIAPVIVNNPLTAAGTVGTPFTFTIAASGSPSTYSASGIPPGLSLVGATISGTPTVAGSRSLLISATNGIGTGSATLTITVADVGLAPIITNIPLTAAGVVGVPFGFTITASGLPTSYTATGLPAGLSIVAATGVITGTPTAAGITPVLLSATNVNGKGIATLTITVGATGAAPIVANNPLTVAGTVGTPFGFTITASGLPTSYTATPLPAGLTIVAATGVITGTPTAVGTTAVLLGATNATGTGTATLTVTVAAAGVAPIIVNSPLTAAGVVGTPFSFTITASGSPLGYYAGFNLPPGLVLNTVTGVISGTPTSATTQFVTLTVMNATGNGTALLKIVIVPAAGAPVSTSVAQGGTATFSVNPSSDPAATYQWRKDAVNLSGATGTTLVIGNVQSANVGFYSVNVTSGGVTTTTTPAQLAMTYTGQISGSATLVGAGIRHPNGNIYDQVLLTGAAASVKANPGQVVRVSYVDLTGDIVQVEFGGAGIMTINLENASGPAAPVKYFQPGVVYMQGHASIAITGADITTNVSVFSVGQITAVDQSLFSKGTTNDGWADIALLTVSSVDGNFGGVRTANANYLRANGRTGLYAPGVLFSGPVYIGNITGANTANAVLVTGLVADARITGGDLLQSNGSSVEVSGMTLLHFVGGVSSNGAVMLAQPNRGRLTTATVDVTAQITSDK